MTHQFNLVHDLARANAVKAVQSAPYGYQVIIKEAKRTTAQSDHMWALISDVAKQLVWHGQTLDTEDWKLVFLNALNSEIRMVPAINKRGYVAIGRRTTRLSKSEMSDLIEIIFKFGAENGVKFYDERAVAE